MMALAEELLCMAAASHLERLIPTPAERWTEKSGEWNGLGPPSGRHPRPRWWRGRWEVAHRE